jgi:hypothetical protein
MLDQHFIAWIHKCRKRQMIGKRGAGSRDYVLSINLVPGSKGALQSFVPIAAIGDFEIGQRHAKVSQRQVSQTARG